MLKGPLSHTRLRDDRTGVGFQRCIATADDAVGRLR